MHYILFEQPSENLYGKSNDPNYQQFYACVKKNLPGNESKITQSADGKLYELKTFHKKNNTEIIFRSDYNVYKEGKVVGQFVCDVQNIVKKEEPLKQQSGQQNTTEIQFTPAEKSALDYVAKQGFRRYNPEPNETQIDLGEFVKLDLTDHQEENIKKYPKIFIDAIKKQFTNKKFPNGVMVYLKGGTVTGADLPVTVKVTREQCQTAVAAIYQETTDPYNTELEPEQEREHFKTIRKCIGRANRLGPLNATYQKQLKYIIGAHKEYFKNLTVPNKLK